MKKLSIGADVIVLWDGGEWTVGTVRSTYRGHRDQIYMVMMDDGELEKVWDYQIICELS
jgi:hypothetical protein